MATNAQILETPLSDLDVNVCSSETMFQRQSREKRADLHLSGRRDRLAGSERLAIDSLRPRGRKENLENCQRKPSSAEIKSILR